MIDFLIGVGVVWGSQVVWAFTRRFTRPKRSKPVQPICGCGDHFSMHDPETGECHAEDTTYVGSDSHGWSRYERVKCGCRRYSGPEPLPSYYAPELSP